MLLFDDDMDVSINYSYHKIDNSLNIFDNFVRTHIMNESNVPPTDMEQEIINGINDYTMNYDYEIIIMSNLGNFQKIMQRALKYFGNDGNYNWIDTSSCTSFMRLF